MILKNIWLACFLIVISGYPISVTWAEPLIVLEFNSQNQFSAGDGENVFSIDPNHSENYIVKSGDSLNSILRQFYTGSGLDWRFVQLSIVIANPQSFAKSNPNFLFSDSRLYLPGKSDISEMLLGKKITKQSSDQTNPTETQNIYFFGG